MMKSLCILSLFVGMTGVLFAEMPAIHSDETLAAAEQAYDHAPDQDDLALALVDVYLFGPTAHRNPEKAVTLLKGPVMRRHPEALELMAGLYVNGRGVEPDTGEAFRLYQMGADAGHGPCLFNVGILYMKQALSEYAHCESLQTVFDLADNRVHFTHKQPTTEVLSRLTPEERQAYARVRAYARQAYMYLQRAFQARQDLESISDAAAEYRNRMCAFLTQDDIYAINAIVFAYSRNTLNL